MGLSPGLFSQFSRKKQSEDPLPAPASKVTRRPQFPTNSQSRLQSPQEKQQSRPVCPWSAPTLPFGQSPSPFLRESHVLSTSGTAAGELFLFGGYVHRSRSPSNDLYVVSTRDFSTTLLQTSGDVPSPRYGHRAVLTSTTLLIWGGKTDFSTQDADNQSNYDSFYLLNLSSREWTRIMVNGPGPVGRYNHTMTLVGSKLFVFGGRTDRTRLNDMWALDLTCLKSNPFWESYEPAPGNEKPLPRAGHVSVTTGDRIIVFGGYCSPHYFNDTWSFDISTRKWTELQCTGSIPSPRAGHAAALVDDVMHVFGGFTNKSHLNDLIILQLSTQRWTAFRDIGPNPCGRGSHAMASDGRRIFVLGGELSPDAQGDEVKPIHVLDTKLLIYPESDANTVKHSEKSSSSDSGAADDAFPFQMATSEDIGRPASPQIAHERNPSLKSLPTGVDDKPRCVLQEDDDSESSAKHLSKLMAPDTSSEKEVVWLQHERIIELERQVLAMRAEQTERDRRIAQLTDKLVQKSALLEQAEANLVEDKKRAGLEQRKLQAKLDELLLSRDQAEANAAEAKKRAGLEQRELQAKLDKLLLSRDQAPGRAQSALQEATFRAAEADERSQRELAELHARLEARESELAAVRLRLMDAEDRWAKSKVEAGTSRAGTQAATGTVNMNVDRVMWRLMERVRVVEAEMASMRGNEKSLESMECRRTA